MSCALHDAGADVSVLTTNKHFHEVALGSLPRSQVTALPLLNERFFVPRATYGRVRDLVSRNDIVHLMSHWTYLNALVGMAAWSLRKPYVVCPAGALKVVGASVIKKRVYDTVIGRRLVQRASRLIAISPLEVDEFASYGVSTANTVVIPNAVDLGDYAERDDAGFRSRFGLSERPFILFLGRLHFIKGPDLLLDAFLGANTQDYDLVLAGPDDGLEEELRKTVIQKGAESRIRFIGHIGGKDKSQALHAAALLVIPSRREAMSIVVLEAGAAGTPVLITNQCGFDQIEAIGGGRVVPASVEGLMGGLNSLLSAPSMLPAMGARLQKYCADQFSWPSRVHDYLALYRRILDDTTA